MGAQNTELVQIAYERIVNEAITGVVNGGSVVEAVRRSLQMILNIKVPSTALSGDEYILFLTPVPSEAEMD